MAYLNTHTRTSSATKNDLFAPSGRAPTLFGVFVGFIKDVADVQKNGRLRVWIPEFGSAPDNIDGWIIVNYCSPFAGATNVETISTTDFKSFEGTQTSYGMWMVPPDINNQVLVMFINGDPGRGIWIGSLYNQFMNNMVPGMASDTNNHQYPGKNIPVAEYNKNNTANTDPDQATSPYQATKFKGLGNQGLINDTFRGVTGSSARRESPSKVFGILTPGPVVTKGTSADKIRRKGGSSFIMDDAEGSEYVQLATKSGAQIHINETNGFVYMINRDGTSWVEMDQNGNISIFGAKNISMRAQRDFNIRADRNINIEAGQNIFMKAAKDTKEKTTDFTFDVNNIPRPSTIPEWSYVGEGKGDGGNIVMQALHNWQSTTQKGAFLTVVENNMDIKIGNTLNVTTVNGEQNFSSKKGVKITTDASLDVAATGNIRVGSNGSINVVGKTGIIVCSSADMSIKAAGTIHEAAGTNILLETGIFGVTAVTQFSSNVDITGTLSVKGPARLVAEYAKISAALGPVSAQSATPPPPSNPAAAQAALSAAPARPAEVKPLNNKLNILATWADATPEDDWTYFSTSVSYKTGDIVRYDGANGVPAYYKSTANQPKGPFVPAKWNGVKLKTSSKFKRNSQSVRTIVSGFPTYEPCPEHEQFNAAAVSNSQPSLTLDDNTYQGSAGPGNPASTTPPPAVDPGKDNTSIKSDPPADSQLSKDINTAALRCQLIIHEGLKNKSYNDTKGLVTGGIGHLMRSNEAVKYPVGTPISNDQIEAWYDEDSASAMKIAQSVLGDTWNVLSDVRKRAVTDLAFNLGKAGLSKFSKFLSAMKTGDYNRAGAELKDSAWYGQVAKRGPNIIAMIVQNVDPTGCNVKFPG